MSEVELGLLVRADNLKFCLVMLCRVVCVCVLFLMRGRWETRPEQNARKSSYVYPVVLALLARPFETHPFPARAPILSPNTGTGYLRGTHRKFGFSRQRVQSPCQPKRTARPQSAAAGWRNGCFSPHRSAPPRSERPRSSATPPGVSTPAVPLAAGGTGLWAGWEPGRTAGPTPPRAERWRGRPARARHVGLLKTERSAYSVCDGIHMYFLQYIREPYRSSGRCGGSPFGTVKVWAKMVTGDMACANENKRQPRRMTTTALPQAELC